MAVPLKTVVAANTATTVSLVGEVWSVVVHSGEEYRILDNRLLPSSPCIDAADNSLAGGETIDLDGNPRFTGDPAVPDTGQGDCPIVDMGAYEHQPAVPECPPCPDCASPADGVVDVADFLALLAEWGAPGPCDLDGNGASTSWTCWRCWAPGAHARETARETPRGAGSRCQQRPCLAAV